MLTVRLSMATYTVCGGQSETDSCSCSRVVVKMNNCLSSVKFPCQGKDPGSSAIAFTDC